MSEKKLVAAEPRPKEDLHHEGHDGRKVEGQRHVGTAPRARKDTEGLRSIGGLPINRDVSQKCTTYLRNCNAHVYLSPRGRPSTKLKPKPQGLQAQNSQPHAKIYTRRQIYTCPRLRSQPTTPAPIPPRSNAPGAGITAASMRKSVIGLY